LGLAAFVYISKEPERMNVKLDVGNLAYQTSEDDLRTLFSQAGELASVAIITDRDTGRSKGFAFVEMTNQNDAQKAISMCNGTKINDRELSVTPARPREERTGFGDKGGRPGGGNKHKGRGGNRRY
jgi:RNA recognition motif-containing protein